MIDRKIYLEPDLDQAILELAKAEDRSITAQIRVLLREAVEARFSPTADSQAGKRVSR